MNIHLHAWTSLKASFPVRKSEWYAAGLVLGMWAVFAFHTELFESNPAYAHMAELASQRTWQWGCFVVGFGRIAALFINGTHWRTPHYRAAFAFLSLLLWYRMTTGLADNMGFGVVFSFGAFVLDTFNFRQAFLEAAAAEGLRHGEQQRLRAKH